MKIVESIKKVEKPSLKDLFLCSYLISQRVSPYISSLYIKKKVVPNKITLHMIYSGILGGILFSMPNIYLKVFGAIFIHLWFVLDCSDGEVARYTKTFSKYGKELDYIAHLIDHPLFGFSMFMSLIYLNRYDNWYLAILIIMSNLMDYLTRNLITLDSIVQIKEEKNISSIKGRDDKWSIKDVVLLITSIFTLYPNVVLFGVIVYFVDYFIGTNILLVYLILNVTLTTLFNIKGLIKLTKKLYTS